MLKLADLYDSDDAPSVVSGFLAVGVSTLFCLGMFMILNSHDASQAAQLRQTVAAVKKSQEDGTDIYTALAQLQAKANSSNSKNKSSLSSLDKSLADANSKYSTGSNDANVNNLTVKGSGSFSGGLSTSKDLNVAGNAKIAGKTTTADFNATGDSALDGDLAVSGDSTIDGGLEVSGDSTFDGAADVQGDFSVEGDSTLQGDLSVSSLTTDSGATVGGGLDVSGAVTIGDTLDVAGATKLLDDLDVTGTTTLTGALTVGGMTTLTDLEADGQTKFNNGITVTGETTLDGTGFADPALAITGGVTIDGSALASGTSALDVTGQVKITVPTGQVGLDVTGATTLEDTLDVKGTTTLNGDLTVADGTTTISNGTLNVSTTTGALNVTTENLVVGVSADGAAVGAVSITGNVTANATIGGAVTVQGDASVGHDLTVTAGGFTESGGDFNMNGTTNTATLNGGATLAGDINIGNVDPAATVGVNNYLTGSFTLTGSGSSATIGRDLNISGGGSFSVQGGAEFDSGSVNHYGSGGLYVDSTSGGGDITFDTLQGGSGGVSVTSTGSGAINIEGDVNSTNFTVHGTARIGEVDGGGALIDGDIQAGGNLTIGTSGSVHTINGVTQFEDQPGFNPFDVSTYGIQNSGSMYTTGWAFFAGVADFQGDIHMDNPAGFHLYLPGSHMVGAASVPNEGVSMNNSVAMYGGADCPASDHHIRVISIYAGIISKALCESNALANYDPGDTGTNATGYYDLAENYPSTQTLSAGDLVAIDTANSEHVVKTTKARDNTAIGVVSTAPGITLGKDGPGYPIALAGRVPVKVTNENGPVAVGDYLTSSSTPGYAMKASPGDKTVGQALEAFTGTTGTVKMFVSNGDEPVSAQQSSVQDAGLNPAGSMSQFSSLNVSGDATLTNLTVTGSATINNLEVTGLAKVADIQINGHIVGNEDTRGTVTVPTGAKTIHHDFAKAYTAVPTVVASPTNQATLYTVVPTATGFDINLPAAAPADTSFSYLVEQ